MATTNSSIYFNNNRSTALHPEVEAAMTLSAEIPHEELYNRVKGSIAAMLNTSAENVRLTSGTTSAIQVGIRRGFVKKRSKGKHIISCVTEHPAVLEQLRALEKEGALVSYLKVDPEGLADPDEFKRLIRPDTSMLCLMAANNETGVIHPLEDFARLCAENQILFFSDGSQYVGKIDTDVTDILFDLLAFGSHKMYGPPGIGALYTRDSELMVEEPELTRPQLAGFAMACEIFKRDHWDLGAETSKLRAYLEHQILDIPEIRINGSTRHRLYNTSNITFPTGADLSLLKKRFDFADNLDKLSGVLAAMGLPPEKNHYSCRFSFGRFNHPGEVKQLVDSIRTLVGVN